MEAKYNSKSPAVKRLMREAQELHQPTADYYAQPLEDNLFEWHFTVRGPDDSAFEGGVYHGRILLPAEYPMKPPSIILLTPNGRFETNKKICLSISGHHPESWRPSWSIRTALMAIIGFLPTPGHGAIAALEYNDEERRKLAVASLRWQCRECGSPHSLLIERDQETAAHQRRQAEAKEIASEVGFTGEKPKSSAPPADSNAAAVAADTASNPAANTATPDVNSSSEDPQPRQRLIPDTPAPPVERRPQPEFAAPPPGALAAAPREEPTWASNTLIVLLVAAIAALLCRRLFLLDAEQLESLPGSL